MSQIINITQAIHDSIIVNIPYVNITAIRSIQVLHKCNETHGKVVKINCSLLENEENYGLIGHIFTNSKLDINDDSIWSTIINFIKSLFKNERKKCATDCKCKGCCCWCYRNGWCYRCSWCYRCGWCYCHNRSIR